MSWVEVDADGEQAAFATWSISGGAITGTWQGVAVVSDGSADLRNNPDPMTGHLAGNQVELEVGTDLSLVGTISPTSLVLHYAGIESDVSETLNFIPGSAATYAVAVAAVRRANGEQHFDSPMKDDLREVANQMETYFTDNNMYPSSITSVSPGRLDVGGQTVQLTNGDAVTLEFVHADMEYCLVASNPATTTRWAYDSSHGGLAAWTPQSCQS